MAQSKARTHALACAAVLALSCADRSSEPAPNISPLDPVVVASPIDAPTVALGPAMQQAPALSVAPSILFNPSTAVRVGEVLTVTLHLVVKNAAGPHQVIAEFVAPGAIDFERRVAPIDGPIDQEKTVDITLPVAGTLIDLQKLTGDWNVRVFVDGERFSTPTFGLAP
jgi:hypothetical protein